MDPRAQQQQKKVVSDGERAGEAKSGNTFAELEKAGSRGGLFSRLGAMIDTGRGTTAPTERPRETFSESIVPERPAPVVEDPALNRAKGVSPRRMIVPDGVIISGSLMSSAETEISGRVDGDVTVDGRLYLGQGSLITGNVRATSCKVEGLVEGRMECSQDIELGRAGRLNADALAGKRLLIAGQVFGNVSTAGLLQLVATGRIEGNIQTRQLIVEEGATFNGRCAMRSSGQKE